MGYVFETVVGMSMGINVFRPKPPADTTRNSTSTTESVKNRDSNALLDQTNKRPQHISRGSASKDGLLK